MIETKTEFCISCMKIHNVKIVEIIEDEIYKGIEISFPAIYKYCDNINEFIEDEEMIRKNNLAMKSSYKEALSESI